MKNLVKAVAFCAAVAFPMAVAGQERPPPVAAPNAVYLELLGNGLLFSLNYDRLIGSNLSARVGFMGLGASSEDHGSAGILAAPIMLNYLTGEGNSHFEAGVGIMVATGSVEDVEGFEDESFSGAVGTATLGYRYQRPGGGFVFRAGLTPLFDETGMAPWFGLSFGYGF